MECEKKRIERTKAASRAATGAAAHASHARHRAHTHAYTPQKKKCVLRGEFKQDERLDFFFLCVCVEKEGDEGGGSGRCRDF